MKRRHRKQLEKYLKQGIGHTNQDDAGTKFLAKHGYGPTGRKRGKIQ